MQEFASRRARTPNYQGTFLDPSVVGLPDQCGYHMATIQVEIVSRPVEVGRHRRDEIAAILSPIRLAQFETSDFGNGVPLISRLQSSREQCALLYRLRREFGIDA